MENIIKIHPSDNVVVALSPVGDIKTGHKIALFNIKKGEDIIKYGNPIGVATTDIEKDDWVHTHNMATKLSEHSNYTYEPSFCELPNVENLTFNGFLRKDGQVGVRNEIWILPLVGCVNSLSQKLAVDNLDLVNGSIDGIYSFPHPYGCSQMGDDLEMTKKLLASLTHHPNAGGVLIVGLGCENLLKEDFIEALGTYDEDRIKFLICQEVDDEFAEGRKLLEELADYSAKFEREQVPASKLIIGMKCGGSDGLSGITANPAVGRFSDFLIAQSGSTILTEVPEMFGAENLLMNRCESEEVFEKMTKMINDFKDYFVKQGQVVYENPSPGNKDGGISTLEDKSCGCIQKGGVATVVDVIDYAERVKKTGLTLLSGPGNDLVSTTAMTAAGAQILLFTTGRGTPFAAPAPTIKISSNTKLFEQKPNWMDFNAGTVATGESLDTAGKRLLDYVIEVANGTKTNAEINGYREIAIFKNGVTL